MNLGALMRTANAFGASFTFSVDAADHIRTANKSDTSRATDHVPYYSWASIDEMVLPNGCDLVGIELTDDAVDLPSFKHPLNAAYVLGRERGDLSQEMLDRCAHVVKIPTRFCINVSLAGALVMYDRIICYGGYPSRPMMPGGPKPEPAKARSRSQNR